ncbi:hypothetical protein CFP56_039875 [Quercus suber]|uniref:Uncharacterized protein n=1 Tax=Quercus suber TaxID=58331 RepID=A0AAW0LKT3_QUESU
MRSTRRISLISANSNFSSRTLDTFPLRLMMKMRFLVYQHRMVWK